MSGNKLATVLDNGTWIVSKPSIFSPPKYTKEILKKVRRGLFVDFVDSNEIEADLAQSLPAGAESYQIDGMVPYSEYQNLFENLLEIYRLDTDAEYIESHHMKTEFNVNRQHMVTFTSIVIRDISINKVRVDD